MDLTAGMSMLLDLSRGRDLSHEFKIKPRLEKCRLAKLIKQHFLCRNERKRLLDRCANAQKFV